MPSRPSSEATAAAPLTVTEAVSLVAYWAGFPIVAFAILPVATAIFTEPAPAERPAGERGAALEARLLAELAEEGAASLTPDELDALAELVASRSPDLARLGVRPVDSGQSLDGSILRRDGQRAVPFEIRVRGRLVDGWVEELEVDHLSVGGWSLDGALRLVDPVRMVNRQLHHQRYKDQPLARFLDRVERVEVDEHGVSIRFAEGGWELFETWRTLPDRYWEPPTGEEPRRPPNAGLW